MATKVSIVAGDAPASIRVEQPGEKPHVRSIEPGSGYDFELIGQGAVFVGGDIRPIVSNPDDAPTDEIKREPGEPVPSDQGNQRPAPDAKPDAGQTSETSELNTEDATSRSRASRKSRDE